MVRVDTHQAYSYQVYRHLICRDCVKVGDYSGVLPNWNGINYLCEDGREVVAFLLIVVILQNGAKSCRISEERCITDFDDIIVVTECWMAYILVGNL